MITSSSHDQLLISCYHHKMTIKWLDDDLLKNMWVSHVLQKIFSWSLYDVNTIITWALHDKQEQMIVRSFWEGSDYHQKIICCWLTYNCMMITWLSCNYHKIFLWWLFYDHLQNIWEGYFCHEKIICCSLSYHHMMIIWLPCDYLKMVK